MDEAITWCSKCGYSIYVNRAHPVRIGRGEEVKQLLCDKCCPNCFGGEGKDGSSESQHSVARSGSPSGEAAAVPLETGHSEDLGSTTETASSTDGGEVVNPS